MRQKIRFFSTVIFLLAFPVILDWLSPYVSQAGAWRGIVTGSVLVFGGLLLSSLFLGRLFCSWVCPGGCVGDLLAFSRTRRYNGKIKNADKYILWAVWLGLLVTGFVLAGGVRSVQPLFMMESGISVDRPEMFITYYGIVGLFIVLNLILGKRAMCHSVCWMAPFMVIGRKLSNGLRLPAFRLRADASACTHCGTCDKNCLMSLPVQIMVQENKMEHSECVLCARCVDNCPGKAIRLVFGGR